MQNTKEIENLINEIETFFLDKNVSFEMHRIRKENPFFMVSLRNLIKNYDAGDLTAKPKIDLALSTQYDKKVWYTFSQTPIKIKEFLSKSDSTGLSKAQIFEIIILCS